MEVTMMADVSGPAAPETLRRDQRERRERIVRVALRSLANSEYDRIKVSDVARDSGVALGTLYRYFTSKEHLFAAAFLLWQEGLKRTLDRAAPPEGAEKERVRDVLHRAIRAFQLQPQFYRVLIVLETASDPYVDDTYRSIDKVFTDIVRSAFGADVRDDADHRAIIATLSSVLGGGLRGWVMARTTIEKVYENIDNAIRLIYDFSPDDRS
ncbi:TetR/AcrR family transcriptional regulator [Sphaerimonospora mesophila]|uniref:TetR/AcrR family transcriptional regulator n=1 Tax=Sphaerimonospora mesophila TaxID=37483 RepID=UPI0006E3FF7A